MKIREKRLYLDPQDRKKGYLVFMETREWDEDQKEEYIHFILDMQNSFFYLNQQTVEQIEALFKRFITRNMVRRSNWAVISMGITSPDYTRSVYHHVLRLIWPVITNPNNYNLIPENKR